MSNVTTSVRGRLTGATSVTRLISRIDPPDKSDTNASFRDLYEDIGETGTGAAAPIPFMTENEFAEREEQKCSLKTTYPGWLRARF